MSATDRGRDPRKIVGRNFGKFAIARAEAATAAVISAPGAAASRVSLERVGASMNSAVYLQLKEAALRRARRNLILELPEPGGERIVLADPSGDVELLLELLATGRRARTDIIREFTSKRDGAEASAVAAALDRLDQLGLIVPSPSGPAQAEPSSHCVPASGIRL